MIESFRHKGLEELYTKGKTRRIRAEYIRKCERILTYLIEAAAPEDLNLPGLHFYGLQGDPQRWSVRVSANYRITFGWLKESALDVDFEDYH